MKKYLLSEEICPYCDGLGVMRLYNSSYRIRIFFINDGDWIILDENYASFDAAAWSVIDMKHENNANIFFEIIKPNGEIVLI